MAEQAHRGGHEERPHDGRVEGHGDRHPDPKRLDEDDVRKGEGAGDDHDDERRRRHDPAAPLEAAGDCLLVVARPIPDLLHPRQEKDLVVHRQAEQDAEEDDGLGRLDEAERLEAEQRREVAILEDPDKGAEARDDRQGVHDERLGRQDHRPKEHEEDEIGRHDYEESGPREVGRDPPDHVSDVRRASTDEDLHSVRRGQRTRARPEIANERPTLVPVRAERGEDRESGEVVLRRRREGGRDEPVTRAVRIGIQELVLLEPEARVDIDQPADPDYTRIRGEPARVVVQGGDVRRTGRRAGCPDRQRQRCEFALTERVRQPVEARSRWNARGKDGRIWRVEPDVEER